MQFLHCSCFVAPSISPLELALDSNTLERMHRVNLDAGVADEFVKITRVLATGQLPWGLIYQ